MPGGRSDDRRAHPIGFDASRRRQDSPPLAGISVHDGTSSDALRQFVRGISSAGLNQGRAGDSMDVTRWPWNARRVPLLKPSATRARMI